MQYMEYSALTHLHGCKLAPCTCSPNSRILLLEYVKLVHAENPRIVAQITLAIETLRKAAVIYTHSPHLLSSP